jgi:hypothetical protein
VVSLAVAYGSLDPINKKSSSVAYPYLLVGYSLVVKVEYWHAGDEGPNLDVCPQRPKHSCDGYVRYIKILL